MSTHLLPVQLPPCKICMTPPLPSSPLGPDGVPGTAGHLTSHSCLLFLRRDGDDGDPRHGVGKAQGGEVALKLRGCPEDTFKAAAGCEDNAFTDQGVLRR